MGSAKDKAKDIHEQENIFFPLIKTFSPKSNYLGKKME